MRVEALLANRSADGHPIDVRQHQIEDDEGEWFGERTCESFASVADGFAVVSDASKLLGDEFPDALLVLNEENSTGGGRKRVGGIRFDGSCIKKGQRSALDINF